jgi:hypothetical protein
MMTGQGPYGAMEMGGMFTTVKVRRDLARNDYKDPGWYKQPANSRAYEWTGVPPATLGAPSGGAPSAAGDATILDVTRGKNHHGH